MNKKGNPNFTFKGRKHTKETKEKMSLSSRNGKTWEESFWSKVKTGSGCWIWMGAKTPAGYGNFMHKDKWYTAHRFAFENKVGKIPKEMLVCHSCDNPSCVNPKHLWLGTPKDNLQDMVKKNRGVRGSKHHLAKLTEQDIKKIRELYKTGKYKQVELSRMFNVGNMQISRIVNKKRWKHV